MIDVWHTHCKMYIFISAAAYYLPALLVMESKKGGDALISFLLARACNKPQHNLATSAPSQLHHPFLVFPWAFQYQRHIFGNSEKDLGTSWKHDSILLWKEMKKRTKRKKGNLLFVAVALLWDNGALRCEASQSVFHGSTISSWSSDALPQPIVINIFLDVSFSRHKGLFKCCFQ